MEKKRIENEIELSDVLKRNEIPYSIDANLLSGFDSYRLRSDVVKKIGFLLVTKEWVEDLSNAIGDKKCLEIMAGSGALSKTLKDKGTNVIATDNFSWRKNENGSSTESWTTDSGNHYCDIEQLDAVEAIKKYKDVDYILMSWAPYEDPIATEVLKAMREYNPNAVLIYFGEGWGGCTANDEFFELVEEVEINGFDFVNVPSWYGINDTMILYK